MNFAQRRAIDDATSEFRDNLNIAIIDFLQSTNVLSAENVDELNGIDKETEKRVKLLQLLKKKDGGWSALLDGLKNFNQTHLIKTLQKLYAQHSTSIMEQAIITNEEQLNESLTVTNPLISAQPGHRPRSGFLKWILVFAVAFCISILVCVIAARVAINEHSLLRNCEKEKNSLDKEKQSFVMDKALLQKRLGEQDALNTVLQKKVQQLEIERMRYVNTIENHEWTWSKW